MSDNHQMEAVAARLQSYQEQMIAVSGALEALRTLADTLISEMAGDVAFLKASVTSISEPLAAAPVETGVIIAAATEFQDSEPVETIDVATIEPVNVNIVASAECDHLEGTEICATHADAEVVSLVATTSTAAAAQTSPPVVAPTNVIDLAQRRKAAKPATGLRRQLTGAVASVMLIFSATAGVHGFLQTELGQQMLDLGTCDAEALSANRDCAFLTWMLL